MSKHTPAPWTVKFRNDGSSYISMGDLLIGPHKQADLFLTSDCDESAIADAILISAAPELLEALKRVVDELVEDKYGEEYEPSPFENLAVARAAIAKATGE